MPLLSPASEHGAGPGHFLRRAGGSPLHRPGHTPQASLPLARVSFAGLKGRACSALVIGFLVAGLIAGCAGGEEAFDSGPPPTPLLKEGELVASPALKEGGLDASATLVSMPTFTATATVAPAPSVVSVAATPSATVLPIATATPTVEPINSPVGRATSSPEPTGTEIREAADINYHSDSLQSSESEGPLCPSDISPASGGNADCPDTPSPTPDPTETAARIDTPTPLPTGNPLDAIRFVEGDDCVDGISRDLLPTMDLMLEYGDSSYLLVVEVADDGHERQQGLMCREAVPFGTGMLFVFEESRQLAFWMFNTYVSLEIVYLDEHRRGMRALRMEPCPRPEGYDVQDWRAHCSSVSIGYGSGGAARYALELPAGWLENIGIELDRLEGVEFIW